MSGQQVLRKSFMLSDFLTPEEISLVPYTATTPLGLLDDDDAAYFASLPVAKRCAFVRSAVRAALTERWAPPGAILPGLVSIARNYGGQQ